MVLPKEPPVIEGADSMYEVGDRVNVTCSSGPSKPAATLSWFINGNQANATFVRKYSSIRHYSGLQTSQVGLEFIVGAKDFDQGKLKLRCVATISQVYSSGSEELIIGDRGQASGSHHVIPDLKKKHHDDVIRIVINPKVIQMVSPHPTYNESLQLLRTVVPYQR
ncbi:uncharacterized protein TNCV_23901 [Trichonephila clavipes]|nr:uncharacterized protein TNCV_23901 [Trichonephila clavipes]